MIMILFRRVRYSPDVNDANTKRECSIVWTLLFNFPFGENGSEEEKLICAAVDIILYKTDLVKIVL